MLLDRPFEGAKDTPRLLRGVNIEHGRAKADASAADRRRMCLRIVLRQGLKRQIRLMLYKVGYEVKRLIRIRIGPLKLTELRAGEWRALTAAEVKALRKERPRCRTGDRKRGGKKYPASSGTTPGQGRGRSRTKDRRGGGRNRRACAGESRPRRGSSAFAEHGLTGRVPPLQLPEPDGGQDEPGVDGVGIFSPADSSVIFAMRFHGALVKHSAFQPCD